MNGEDRIELLNQRIELQSAELAVDPAQFKKSFLNIAYASDSEDQKLDVFLPEEYGTWPVVVFVHGGGWFFGGRREQCISSIFKIVSQGYAVATIDYRLVPDAFFPAQIYDVKAAIRYLRAHAEELQIDPAKIVIWGNSAGGHLVALAGAKGESARELEDLSMGNAEYSSEVDGIIDWYGVFDFHTQKKQLAEQFPDLAGSSAPHDPADVLLSDDPEGYLVKASPIFHVTPDYPPILLQQGTEDRLVPWKQAELFAEKIRSICGEDRVTLELFPGAGHGAPAIKCDENILRIVKFLDSIYYPDAPCPYERGPLPELRFVASMCRKIDPYEKA